MRKFQIGLIFILIVSTILSACGVGGASAVVRIGWVAGPDTLNPGMAQLIESFNIFSLIYDTLYEQTLDGNYRLSLAESVDISEDNKTWTFKIRDGVKFHDGESVSADDVAFSFNYYMEHAEEFPFLPGYAANFERVRALPGNKVLIQLTQAIPNMESQLISLYVLPKHIWEGNTDPTQMDIPVSQMVGSGPFKLTTYEPGKFIRLDVVRTHFYYHPKIGAVEFLIYANVSSMVQALQNKEIDLIANLPVSAVSALKDMKGVQVVTGPSASPIDGLRYHFQPNCSRGLPCGYWWDL
ncbi:MAG: ABC transporter substrate-binding protein [Anaerolineales bacterium]